MDHHLVIQFILASTSGKNGVVGVSYSNGAEDIALGNRLELISIEVCVELECLFTLGIDSLSIKSGGVLINILNTLLDECRHAMHIHKMLTTFFGNGVFSL